MVIKHPVIAALIFALTFSQQLLALEIDKACPDKLKDLTVSVTYTFEEKIPLDTIEVENDTEIAQDPDLKKLTTEDALAKGCVESGVCKLGDKVPRPFRFLYKFALRAGKEFKETAFAFKGTYLRTHPQALADFFKNLAIIWTGQIYGAMKVNGLQRVSVLNILGGLKSLKATQVGVLENTGLMVFTQSERTAGKTEQVELPKVRSFRELFAVLGPAYRGKNGFVKEAVDRFVATIALIPVEIANFSIVSAILAAHSSTPFMQSFGHNFESYATFSILFGTFLATKWAIVSKVIDLRLLPVVREWMSHSWISVKDSRGLRAVSKTPEGFDKIEDEVSLSKLMTSDFYKFLKNKEYECTMNAQCQFSTEDIPTEEKTAAIQYARRWQGYRNLYNSPEIKGIGLGGILSHVSALPTEMAYRYANTLIDGYFVMWLSTTGTPLLLNYLKTLHF